MTGPGADRPVDLLAPAAQLALAVARRDASSADAPPPPARLRPFLSFRRPLPSRAVAAALAVLDEDDVFRTRVVAAWEEAGDPDGEPPTEGVGDASAYAASACRAFLLRPEGWEDELAALADRSDAAAEARRAEAEDRAAARRVAQLEANLARLRAEVDGLRRDLDDERAARRSAETELEGLREALAATEDRRTKAVQDLAAARALADERLEELRRSRSAPSPEHPGPAAPEAAPGPGPVPDLRPAPRPGPDLDAAARLLARAAEAAEELGGLVRRVADGLGVGTAPDDAATTVTTSAPVAPRPAPAPPSSPGRPRRSPVGLRRGVMADTAEAVDQLLRVPRMVAVVDGYNVSMAGWPTLDHGGQREQLLRVLSEVVARTGAEVHAVFDGDADGRRPSVFAPMPVRVHFSAEGVEADDVVLDLVGRLPVDRPVLVVSSDRAVRDGATRRGADSTSSASLLDWWRR